MRTIEVTIDTIELLTALPERSVVAATANGQRLGRDFDPGRATVIHPSGLQAVLHVADEEPSIAMVVRLGARPAVSFRVPVPDETCVRRHVETRSAITVSLLNRGGVAATRAVVTRSHDGRTRATVSLGGAPAAVRVEFVRPASDEPRCPVEGRLLTVMRMGLWENAYDGTRFRNTASDSDHFIGLDPRRFYLRVVDARVTASEVQVNLQTWWASGTGRGVIDDGGRSPSITCTAAPGRPGVFVSRALMLVSSDVDLQANVAGVPEASAGVHSGDIPNGSLRRRGEPDFRLRKASMYGHVEATYAGADEPARAELFRGERRRVRVCFYEVNDALHDTGRITGDPAVSPVDELWVKDLRVAREIYGRYGIWVESVEATHVPAASRSSERGPGGLHHLARVTLASGPRVAHGDYRSRERWTVVHHPPLALANPRIAHTISCFYLPNMVGVNGQTWTQAFVAAASHREQALESCMFINTQERGSYTLAHEMNHALVNSHGEGPEQHYPDDGPDAAHNLLWGHGMPSGEAWNAHNRIREEHVLEIFARLGQI